LPESKHYPRFLQWNHLFATKGLAPEHASGSYGNMSFRLSAQCPSFIITRTSASLKNMTMADCVCVDSCDFEQFKINVRGTAEPSSESFIHAKLYEQLPAVNAIFHGHSDAILSLKSIPTTEEEYPYGTLELMHAALKLKEHAVFNLKNHGFFSTAPTLDIAGEQATALLG